MEIIDKAKKEARTLLSEHESKQILRSYNIPVTRELVVERREDLAKATSEIGFPLVLKGCAADISHKTEMSLIRTDVRNDEEAVSAFDEIMANMQGTDGAVLVQEMVKGQRELVIGLTRDPQFGPCVMFGLGGIFTEILKDISFRVAPLEERDALEMMKEIKGARILDGVRGMEPADLDAFSRILITVGQIGLENERISEIDINPVIISGNQPVAVDALVVLSSEE